MFKKLFGGRVKEIAIDLGTSYTRVYVKDKGILINEPTVVAINNKTDQIISVGQEAKNMLGKTPPHITVSRPLTHGIVSDYEVAEKLMKYFIDKVYEGSSGMMSRPRIVISVPLEVTEVEMKAVEDAAYAAGAKEVALVQEPMVAAIGARMPIQDPIGNMIINIGGGTTEVAVISLGGVVIWKSTKIAGDEMNKNIIQYAKEVFNLLVGESHAELIKQKIGTAIDFNEKLEFPMRGRDIISGLPREVMVTDAHVREAIGRSVQSIADIVKMTLEITPPELTADIHERGLLISGGGSLLKGIEQIISDAADVPVRVAGDPQTAVVRGTGILLENPELLAEVALPSTRRK